MVISGAPESGRKGEPIGQGLDLEGGVHTNFHVNHAVNPCVGKARGFGVAPSAVSRRLAVESGSALRLDGTRLLLDIWTLAVMLADLNIKSTRNKQYQNPDNLLLIWSRQSLRTLTQRVVTLHLRFKVTGRHCSDVVSPMQGLC
jgi:hypothetical protein